MPTTDRMDVQIRAHDQASGVLTHISRRMGIFNQQGIAMGVAFAGVTMGINAAMSAIKGFIQGLKEAFEKAVEFEKGIAKVNTMLSGTSEKYLPAMRQAIMDMSVEFGKSTTDLSEGMYQVLSASVDASEAIDVLRQATRAAVAGFTSVETAVDAATTVMNAYGMQAIEIRHINDVMFKAVQRGKMTYEEFAGSLGYVAKMAADAKISFETIAASFATLTRQGIKANMAARGLRQLMASLIAPTEEQSTVAQKQGIILNDLSLEVLGLEGQLNKMNEATNGSVGAMKELIPNIRALQAGLGLAGVASFTFDLNQMADALGATAEAEQDVTESLYHQWEQLKKEQELEKIRLGLQPDVIAANKTLAEWEITVTKTTADIVKGWQDLWTTKPRFGDLPPIDASPIEGFAQTWAWVTEDIQNDLNILSSLFGKVKEEVTIPAIIEPEPFVELGNIIGIAGQNVSFYSYEMELANSVTEKFMDKPADLAAQMYAWGRAIDDDALLIKRLEYETSNLDSEMSKLNTRIESFTSFKNWENDLHYITLALEDAAYTNNILDTSISPLVDSIRIQREEIKRLTRVTEDYRKANEVLSIESMEIELSAMNHRGRMTRSEKRRLNEIRKLELQNRINIAKTNQQMDKQGLSDDEEHLNAIKRGLNEEIYIYKKAQDTTLEDLKNNLSWKKYVRDTYVDTYLPAVLQRHYDNLIRYNAGLNLIETSWSSEQKRIWEETAGSIEENARRIIAAKKAIAENNPDIIIGASAKQTIIVTTPVLPMGTYGGNVPFPPPSRQRGGFIKETRDYRLHAGEYVTPSHEVQKGGRRDIYHHMTMPPIHVNIVDKRGLTMKQVAIKVSQAVRAGMLSGITSEFEGL